MLNKKNLKKYLLEHNLTEDVQKCEVEELSGGIINRIFRAKTEKGVFVLKQFLDKAKIDKNIRLSPKRFFYEKYAINYLDRILDKKITPPIVFFDDKNKIICMKDLGVNNRLDNLMLSNRLKPDVFSKIGKVLAEIHNKSFFNDSLSLLFDNEEFQELKFDYRYYRTMKYSSLIYARDELIQNCRKNKITFIHNDLKINNFFVLDNNKFCLIDYEGSYYGDPAFEVGYLLGHLFVYYFNQPNLRNKKIVLNFWNNYIYS